MIGPVMAEGADWQSADLDTMLATALAGRSNRKLAKEIGVGEASIRRWRSGGTRPKAASRAKLEREYARVRLTQAQEAAARIVQGATLQVEMRAPRHEDNGRIRYLDQGNLRLDPRAGELVAAAYGKGGAEAAAAAYVKAVKEEAFYRPWLAAGLVTDWDRGGDQPDDDDYDWLYDYADEYFADDDGYGFGVS